MYLIGLFIPLLGTTLGAGCVFLLRDQMSKHIQRMFLGFSAGVMVAASIWSLLIPAIEQSEGMGKLSFIPAAVGFCAGIAFLLLLDETVPHIHPDTNQEEGLKRSWKKTTKLFLTVTIHNIPEGISVGVVFAGVAAGNAGLSMSGAIALAVGIAIQNFPEGAIISMPMQAEGVKKGKAFLFGFFSGVVEPAAAGLTLLFSRFMVPVLPYLLSFAAGAMLYVVVEELIPEMSQGSHSNIGVISFSLGFVLMMVLDVALG